MPLPALAIAAIGSGIQGGLGLLQSIKGDKEADRLRKQRKAYQTPEEIFQLLEATQSRASTGYDPETLDYLTNQTDRAFNSTLSTARMLGVDPNTLGAAFDSKVNQIMKIGAENQALNMANFNKYLSALEIVAANDAAEQKSEQDMLKDDIQAAVGEKKAGIQNVGNAFNSLIGTASAQATSNLYNTQEQIFKDNYGARQGTGAFKYAQANNLNYKEYKNELDEKLRNFKIY